MITLSELSEIMPYAGRRASLYLEPLNAAMEQFQIDTPDRQAAFLAQVAHESGSLKYVEELASGDAYEGRANLGNTAPGDGRLFKGRGLLQITGRDNYRACSLALFGDLRLLLHPEMLEEPDNAARSAAWYWRSRGLNVLADQGRFRAITRKINGGLTGLDERLAYWEKAKDVLA
jgi:putative chitinase